jgi:hypothetical protein
MTRTMKQNALPECMTLVETDDGRSFPAFASLSEIPHRIDVMEDPPLIPPACDSFDDPGQGLDCREEGSWMTTGEGWQRAQNCIPSAMPGISMRLRSWLEVTHRACTAGYLCMRWCSRDEQQAMRSLRPQAIHPMRPSKPSISACTSGLEAPSDRMRSLIDTHKMRSVDAQTKYL